MSDIMIAKSSGTMNVKSMTAQWFAPTRIQATAVRIATLLLIVYATACVQGFASLQNLSSIIFTTASVGIAACGLALVTISGNLFMLSIGATTSVATIVFVSLLSFGIFPAVLMTLAMGVVLGLVQGGAIGRFKTNPIITSIAASSVITGLGSWFSGGRTLTSDVTVHWLGVGYLVPGIPNQIIILAVMLVATEFFLSRMRLGREIQLLGTNENTAALSGLRVNRAVMAAYIFASVAAVISGILIASQASQGNLSLGSGLDFSAIAAVLVGGIAINGGQGRIYDAAIGAFFLSIISNILLLRGYSLDIQLMVKGAVVLFSVLLGALMTRKYRK